MMNVLYISLISVISFIILLIGVGMCFLMGTGNEDNQQFVENIIEDIIETTIEKMI